MKMAGDDGVLLLIESSDPCSGIRKVRLRSPLTTGIDLMNELNESTLEVYRDASSSFVPLERHHNLSSFRRIRVRIKSNSSGMTSNDNLLMIQGRYLDWNGSFHLAGHGSLRLEEDTDRQEDGTGVAVWDGAVLLAQYLRKYPRIVTGSNILELGAGVGLVGLVASVLGSESVTLTDLPYCLSLTKRNIEKNRGLLKGVVKAQELDWFQPPPTLDPKPDVILVADCVWTRQLVQPLLSTLSTLCDPDTTIIYISYQRRGKDTHDAFTTGLQDRFVVDTMDIKGVSESPLPEEKFFIFRCQHWDGAVR